MSQTKKWLDFKPYGMRLALARSKNPNYSHTLLFAGEGLKDEATLQALRDLGFSRDMRWPQKHYWTRSFVGVKLTDLREKFPRSLIVDLPVEEISPAIKHELKQRQGAGVKNESNSEPRSRPTGIAARTPPGSVNDARSGANGALGAGGASNDVREQPLDDAQAAPRGAPDRVPERTGRGTERPSPDASETVATAEPAAPDRAASGANGLAQPGEVVRNGSPDEQPEREDSVAARPVPGNSGSLTPEAAPEQPDQGSDPVTAVGSSDGASATAPTPAEVVNEDGLSAQEYARAQQIYGNGVGGDGQQENPFDSALEPVPSPKGLDLDNPDLESDLYLDTREAFDRRDYAQAYALYQKGMGSNGVERDAFEEAFAGLSGGRGASLYLSKDQRRELHRMGMRDNLVEHFALNYVGAEANLAYAFDFATQNDALVASSLTQRMSSEVNGIGGQIKALGFEHVRDEDPATGAPEYLYRSPSGESLVVGVGQNALHITGHNHGQVLPAFEVRDNLDTSVASVGEQIRAEANALWPHLFQAPAKQVDQANEEASAPAEEAKADQPAAPVLDAHIADIRAVVATQESQPAFNNGWLVMNAARPLLGHATENGKFLDGVHYAAIDPDDSLAATYIEENRKLNASIVVTATQDEQALMAIAGNRNEAEYKELHAQGGLLDQASFLISKMQHTPYGQMKALLQRVREEQQVTVSADQIDTPAQAVEAQPSAVVEPSVPSITSAPAVIHTEGEFESAEAEQVYSIDRVWRGSTLQHMLDTQGRTPSTSSIFAALKSFESGEPTSDVSKRTLAAFRGWGVEGDGLRVDNRKSHENHTGNQIAAYLGMTPGDFQRAYMDNRLESYYTPPQLCDAIWKGVMRAGVNDGGKFLDAGCGAAAFFAAAPDNVQSHATLIGVEADPITARLAAAVAPDARIIHSKYEQAVLARDFDAVIGNVPFGSTKIHDSNYPDAHHIHDYFILRSLDQLKPGGIAAVITSAGSLDKGDPKVREEMLQRADLVGAVRLPRETFSHLNAQVATDILFLQRRPDGTKPSYDYTQSVRVSLDEQSGSMYEDDNGSEYINRYYLDNPENILGKYEIRPTAFGPKPALVDPDLAVMQIVDRFDSMQVRIESRINEFMPEGLASKKNWEPVDKGTNGARAHVGEEDWSTFERIEQRQDNFVGDNIIADDGRILEIVDIAHRFDDEGVLIGHQHIVAETNFAGKRAATMEAYIGLRDASRELIAAQLNGSDQVLSATQEKAKLLYDAFTKKFGPVNANKNVRIYGEDAGSAEVCALEVWDDEEEQVLALADTFEKRVIGAELVPNIETAEDAYYHSLDRKGRVDFDFMAEVLGQEVDQIKDKLIGDLVFLNPITHQYEPQHQYLSGNVVLKLAEAEQALASMPELQPNVDKLRETQPDPIPFEDISLRLGVGWIPERDIEQFVSELFGTKLTPRDFSVRYTPELGSWAVEVSSSFKTTHETRRSTMHGTKDCPFERLLEMHLNSQKPTHYDKVDGKSVVNDERTMSSRAKQEDIESAFKSWVAKDVDRIHRFTELYNANCNNIALPKIDGSRITFPGLASTWNPRTHQSDQVAMSLMGYNCMAAHCVGAGKTFEMVAIAIKLKQVGLCNKPSIAVPNHMLGQITREAKQMFPSARILQVTADDLKGAARQRFLARARNNDWDLVVFTHGMMNRLQAPLEIQTRELAKSIGKIEAKIADADGRVKRQLEASLKTQISKLESVEKAFKDEQLKSGVLTIDKLGIDLINVDEIHLYKNLAINSNMNVLGVTRGGSQRAENLSMLTEYMRDLHGRSFGINGFTGTPVSNTICELYVHGARLRPELFQDQGIHDFDEWAKRFGDVVSALEPLPEGGGFRVNERFARFVNLPEMISLFRSFADVKNASDLNLPVPEVEMIIESVDQSDFQKDFMKHLAIRATQVRSGSVRPHEDNMLSIATAGRKAALDLRLVNPIIPDDASAKLPLVAKNVHIEWERHGDVKAAQIIFMDQGTPKPDASFTTYQKLRDLLVERGIPDHEIAFVHEAKNDTEKEALFDKVRKGDIRVLIGSTEKMGVGTNVQDRLVALHDVDCPWRPSDIAQRRGRIERQGNKFFESVRNYRYTTKDSFDLFMWGGNQRKANFIAQALGDPTKAGREVSEDVDLGYAEVMAVTTGNPKIKEKVQTDDLVNKMERKRRTWQSDLYTKASAARNLRSTMSQTRRMMDAENILADALPKGVGGKKPVEISGVVTTLGTEGSWTALRATEVGKAILQRYPIAEARLMKFNEAHEKLGMSIGKIQLMLEHDISTKQSFIRGKVGDQLLPTRIGISKSEQSMGAMVRELYDTDFRMKRLEEDLRKDEAGYELVKDFKLDSEWPEEGEFVELKNRQRELNVWFAAQDFNSSDTVDPFKIRMDKLEQELARQITLSDLEREIAANGDLAMLDRSGGFGAQDDDVPNHEEVVTLKSGPNAMRLG